MFTTTTVPRHHDGQPWNPTRAERTAAPDGYTLVMERDATVRASGVRYVAGSGP